MLVDHVICDCLDPAFIARSKNKRRDVLRISWRDLGKRAIRAVTASGTSVGVLLSVGKMLRHGDVVFEDADSYLVVEIEATNVFVAKPRSGTQMGSVAVELGNHHLPVEVTEDGKLITPVDGPAAEIFRRHQLFYSEEVRRFQPMRSSIVEGVRLSSSFQISRK